MSSRHVGRAGYTLQEMLGVVVVLGIVLGLAAPSVLHALKVRRAEFALKHDLDNAALFWENTYVTERRYPDFAGLVARGYELSPEVVVDSQAVVDERVLLRLRHVPTGQVCVLDYSRSSAHARNWSDCYAGGQPRDTALTITAEPPAPAGVDTFGVPEPPSTPPEPNPLELSNPAVNNPPDQVGEPGSTMTQTFTVTNTSGSARSFRFEVGTSNAAVVGDPGDPGAVTLMPGVATPVTVGYGVAEAATAEASSVIALRAVDVEDERWVGAGSFMFSTALVLAAPGVSGPASRSADAEAPFDAEWTVTNRSNGVRTLDVSIARALPAHVVIVSAEGLGRFPFAAGETRVVRARLKLADSLEGGTRSRVELRARDAESPTHTANAGFDVETRVVLAAPVVVGSADLDVEPGAAFTLRWDVRNGSNQRRTFDVQAPITDGGHLAVVSASGVGVRSIERGAAAAVEVTYRVRPGSVAGWASGAVVSASDAAARVFTSSDTVRVGTRTVLAAPAVVGPADRSGNPGERFTVSWVVTNRTNAPRSISALPSVPAGGEVAIVSSVGAGRATQPPFADRTVSVTYEVRADAVAGARTAPTLEAYDDLAIQNRGGAQFGFVTAEVLAAPVLRALGDARGDPSSAGTVAYRIVNRSNAPRRFMLEASSSSPRVVGDPSDPAPLTVPAFDSAAVQVAYEVAEGAVADSAALLLLQARDVAATTLEGAASARFVTNLVVQAPAVAASAGATGRSGEGSEVRFTIRNRTNARRVLTFEAASTNRAIVSDPQRPPAREVDAFGAIEVSVPVSFAAATADDLRGEVRLSSSDAGRSGAAGAVVVRVNRAPVITLALANNGARTLEAFRFTASAVDPDGSVSTYRWAVWSPHTQRWEDVDGTGSQQSHVFPKSGRYYVYAAGTDNNGGLGEAFLWSVDVVNRGPTATPVFDPEKGELTFTDISFTSAARDEDGSIAAIRWYIIDPEGVWTAVAGGSEVTRQFERAGSWRAYVSVTDDEGAVGGGYTEPIAVLNRPPTVESILVTPNPAKLGDWEHLDAAATDRDGRVVRREWFAIGPNGQWIAIGDAVQPRYQFPEPGQWYLYVRVYDDLGAWGERYSDPVVVNPRVRGCKDPTAINYNPGADDEDIASCTYRNPLPEMTFDITTDECYCGGNGQGVFDDEKHENYKVFIKVRQPAGDLKVERWRVLSQWNLRMPDGSPAPDGPSGPGERRHDPVWMYEAYETTQGDRWWPAAQELFGVKRGREQKKLPDEFSPTQIVLDVELKMTDGQIHVVRISFPFWNERSFVYTHRPLHAIIVHEPVGGAENVYDFSGLRSYGNAPRQIRSYMWDPGDFSPRIYTPTFSRAFLRACDGPTVLLTVMDQFGATASSAASLRLPPSDVRCRPRNDGGEGIPNAS